VRSEDDYLE